MVVTDKRLMEERATAASVASLLMPSVSEMELMFSLVFSLLLFWLLLLFSSVFSFSSTSFSSSVISTITLGRIVVARVVVVAESKMVHKT